TVTANAGAKVAGTANLSAPSDHAQTVSDTASDTAGNTASSTGTAVTLDTVARSVPITSAGGPTNQPSQLVSGTGEAGTTVTLFDNGSQLQLPTITVAQNGVWSANVTLANGSNSLTASDSDAAGNSATSA